MNDSYVLPDGVLPVVPDPEGLDARFWEGTRAEEIWIQQCNACSNFQWLPEWVCHHCNSFDLGFSRVAPSGTIYSWERVWHPSTPALASHCPFVVVVIELDSAPGIRLVGNLVGDSRQSVSIGTPVEAVFEHHSDYTLVQWKPRT
ncbi:DNA-binding protein [Rhodococcus sp. ACPA4]|uniref:Zn-ribbon domain-containing OB-fold protein n=1 Tax=Rhodococcus sp. ACPA4 TaxID=2028571 RepID=UPI000BB1440F|nr:OB-fold domain-containing protein [Rhodococcus sp. ACPA4]PBC35963.1 DNA-binding protein [Rhodococcus sp. ACPA4]